MFVVVLYVGLLALTCSIPLPEDASVMDRIWQAHLTSKREIHRDSSSKTQLIEMDIVNTARLQAEIRALRAGVLQDAISYPGNKWPNGIVPYVISETANAQLRQAFLEAAAEYNAKTCVRFVPRVNETDYISVFADSGCYSFIGRQGAKQDLSLGSGCEYKGIAIHEMMHALGFFHEQSRRDRDSYIRVQFQNIVSGMSYNFDMYQAGEADTLGEPYDKQSVMHYGNYAFSSNGQKTIVSLSDPNEVLGQRNGLSDIDVRQINIHYQCGSATVATTTAATTRPPAVTTQPPAVTTQPPAVTTRQPAITTRPPSVTTRPPAVTTRAPAITTQPPAVTTRPSAVTTQPPAVTTRPPAVTSQAPAVTTRLLTVTTQSPATCGDGFSFCQALGAYCAHDWVQTNCRHTCDLCPASCVDTKDNCSVWRQYCSSTAYIEYMSSNCPKTCALC